MLPLPMLLMIFSERFLKLLGQDPTTPRLPQSYLRPFAIVMPLLMLRMVFEQIMFGFKKQTPAMVMSLITFAISLFFSIVLCFGLFYFRNWVLADRLWFYDGCFASLRSMGLYLAAIQTLKDIIFLVAVQVVRIGGK